MKCFYCDGMISTPFRYRPGKGRVKFFCPDDMADPMKGSQCFDDWMAERKATTAMNRRKAAIDAKKAGKIKRFGKPFGKADPRPNPNPRISAIEALLDLLKDMGQNIEVQDLNTMEGKAAMIRIGAAETALNAARRMLMNSFIAPGDIIREKRLLLGCLDPGKITGMEINAPYIPK